MATAVLNAMYINNNVSDNRLSILYLKCLGPEVDRISDISSGISPTFQSSDSKESGITGQQDRHP